MYWVPALQRKAALAWRFKVPHSKADPYQDEMILGGRDSAINRRNKHKDIGLSLMRITESDLFYFPCVSVWQCWWVALVWGNSPILLWQLPYITLFPGKDWRLFLLERVLVANDSFDRTSGILFQIKLRFLPCLNFYLFKSWKLATMNSSPLKIRYSQHHNTSHRTRLDKVIPSLGREAPLSVIAIINEQNYRAILRIF